MDSQTKLNFCCSTTLEYDSGLPRPSSGLRGKLLTKERTMMTGVVGKP